MPGKDRHRSTPLLERLFLCLHPHRCSKRLGNHRGRITVGKCHSVPDSKRFEECNLFLVSISKCFSGCYLQVLHQLVLYYGEGGRIQGGRIQRGRGCLKMLFFGSVCCSSGELQCRMSLSSANDQKKTCLSNAGKNGCRCSSFVRGPCVL